MLFKVPRRENVLADQKLNDMFFLQEVSQKIKFQKEI